MAWAIFNLLFNRIFTRTDHLNRRQLISTSINSKSNHGKSLRRLLNREPKHSYNYVFVRTMGNFISY